MNLYTAESSEIVRSALRDEEHLNEIESSLSTLIHFTLRSHRRFVSQQWVSTIARAFYYSSTTVSGVQTIGEEYLGLVQMQGSNPRFIASDSQRLLGAMIETFHPIVITKIFNLLAFYGDLLRKQNYLHPALYKLSQELPLLSTSFISFIKTFNIALFYIFSTPYYDFSKAVADIKYRSIRPQANLQSQKLYKIMGIASLIRLLIVAKRKAESFAETADEIKSDYENNENVSQHPHKFECSLCFDKAPPVSTPCGHCFCWNCIERTKESCDSIGVLQCPTCRFQFENNRMLLKVIKKVKFQSLRKSSSHSTVYVSGIQPTGVAHLGNYFGFIKTWIQLQNSNTNASKFLAVVDLHAITTGLPPSSTLKDNIIKMTASLLACGVDPDKTVLFQQSQIPEHCQLSWILGSLQTITQLQRLPQYKDKSKKYTKGQVPLGLVSYPVLQSADVLLYKGTHVPVGEDQSQHMNLLSDIAERFNFVYKIDHFPVPQMVKSHAPRIKSLKDPSQKMSKSDPSEFSRIDLSDDSDLLLSKIKRGLTDTTSTISYDWENRPGVSNLISIYSAFTNISHEDIVKNSRDLDTLGFKKKLYEIAEETLAPIRKRYNEICNNEAYIWEVLNNGSDKARNVAEKNLDEVKKLVGFR